MFTLIHLDSSVDLADEPKARHEPNERRKQKEKSCSNDRVAKVEHHGYESRMGERRQKIVNGVRQQVHSREPRRDHAPPPPSVVFSAQLEVTQHNSNLGASDGHYHKHNQEEPKDVVISIKPDGVK